MKNEADEEEAAKWKDFEYKAIYNVSEFPLLSWLDGIFRALCDPNRHEMRLASVVTVAGHMLKEVYHCPVNTNFYTMSFMPTGTGKERFMQTIDAILDLFHCQSQLCSDIGSYQGLFAHLKDNDGKAFNLIDEIG